MGLIKSMSCIIDYKTDCFVFSYLSNIFNSSLDNNELPNVVSGTNTEREYSNLFSFKYSATELAKTLFNNNSESEILSDVGIFFY